MFPQTPQQQEVISNLQLSASALLAVGWPQAHLGNLVTPQHGKGWSGAWDSVSLTSSHWCLAAGPWATLGLARMQALFFIMKGNLRRWIQEDPCKDAMHWPCRHIKSWNYDAKQGIGRLCWEPCQHPCPTGNLLSASKFFGKSVKCSIFFFLARIWDFFFLPILSQWMPYKCLSARR